jgi:hypothetical protein
MRNSRAKRIILCTLMFAILISTVTALSGHAEDYPDISKINSNLYLNGNQQFFHRPGGGYALISTDLSGKTMISLLDGNGNFDYNCGRKSITVKFVYEKAAPCGSFLYLAGWSAGSGDCIEIQQIDMSTGKRVLNKIVNVNCSFSRTFSVDDNVISLVTVPVGTAIDDLTSVSRYIFNPEYDGGCIEPESVTPASSAVDVSSGAGSSNAASTSSDAPSEASSASGTTSNISSTSSSVSSTASAASSASSSVSSSSSTASSQPPEKNEPSTFHFDAPVTVAVLRKELEANAPDKKLRVSTADHKVIKQGKIGTGSIVETTVNGITESSFIAVIPGDLDGTGTVTARDYQILYDYFTKSPAQRASVLSGPYFEAALLNDTNTIDPSRTQLHPGDILKIKKLLK